MKGRGKLNSWQGPLDQLPYGFLKWSVNQTKTWHSKNSNANASKVIPIGSPRNSDTAQKEMIAAFEGETYVVESGQCCHCIVGPWNTLCFLHFLAALFLEPSFTPSKDLQILLKVRQEQQLLTPIKLVREVTAVRSFQFSTKRGLMRLLSWFNATRNGSLEHAYGNCSNNRLHTHK